MILYHGTDAKYLDQILTYGLLPRKITKNNTYSGNELSHKDFVYLTKLPVMYAYSIPDIEKLLILKVEIDENDLYPDEDFVERFHFVQGTKLKLTDINPKDYKSLTQDSLKWMQNACIEKVEPHQIEHWKILDAKDHDFHCGLGAQGTAHLSDNERANNLHGISKSIFEKYFRRIELLFEKGWVPTRDDIIKESPSEVLGTKAQGFIILKNGENRPVLMPPNKMFNFYVCNQWNLKERFYPPIIDKRAPHFIQIPVKDVLEYQNE